MVTPYKESFISHHQNSSCQSSKEKDIGSFQALCKGSANLDSLLGGMSLVIFLSAVTWSTRYLTNKTEYDKQGVASGVFLNEWLSHPSSKEVVMRIKSLILSFCCCFNLSCRCNYSVSLLNGWQCVWPKGKTKTIGKSQVFYHLSLSHFPSFSSSSPAWED